MSSPMRVEREVTRGWGGTRLCNQWPHDTLCTRHAHARNSPEERWARWTCVRSTLGVRSRRAMCALGLSRRTHNACPACAPRVPRVCRALVQRALRMAGVVLRMAGVELRAQFCACTKIPTHTTNDDECTALVQRARRTSSAW